MRIYITHCSAKKDDSLKNTDKEVSPDKLYTSNRTQSFIRRCKEKKVNWAIFSDLYGVWFPYAEHRWYDKHPNKIVKDRIVRDEKEFERLLTDFDQKLRDFDEIWFYYHPTRFHPLYELLLQKTRLKDKVKRFTHITDIV